MPDSIAAIRIARVPWVCTAVQILPPGHRFVQ